MLKRKDHDWQRLIASTGQPNFLNKDNLVKYLAREKDRDIERREIYLKNKCDILGECPVDPKSLESVVGASGTMNY